VTTNARPARSLPGESPPPVEDAPEYPDDYDQPEGDSLDWRKIISGAKLTGPVRNIAASSQVLALTESFARLRVSVGAFATEGNRRLLEQRLSRYFGTDFHVEFEIGEQTAETVSDAEHNEREAARRALIDGLEADPLVQKVVKLFHGTIDESSVTPLKK
jgi:hypothetical protein